MTSKTTLIALVLFLFAGASLMVSCEGSNVTAYVVKIPGYQIDLPWAQDCSWLPKTCLPDLPALPSVPGGANPLVSSIVHQAFAVAKGVISTVAKMIPQAQPYLVTEMPPVNKELMDMNPDTFTKFGYYAGYLALTAGVGTVLGVLVTCLMILFFFFWLAVFFIRLIFVRRKSSRSGFSVVALIIRWVPAIIILAAFMLPFVGTYIGLSHSEDTSRGFSNLIDLGSGFVEDALDLVQGGFDWIDNLFDDLFAQTDSILAFLDGVLIILDPLYEITDILDDLHAELFSFKEMTIEVVDNITDIATILGYMADAAAREGADIAVPGSGDIPSISDEQLGQIDTALNNIITVRDSIDEMADTLHETLSGLSDQVGDQINEAIGGIKDQVNDQLSQFKDMKNMASDYYEAYLPYAADLVGYERYRNYVWAITFVVPVFVFVLVAVLFIFNWKPTQFIPCLGLWVIAALIMLLCWICFLFFGVEYILATATTETCERHEIVITNLTDAFAGEMIAELKKQVNISDFTVMDLLTCSGDNNLANIAGLSNLINVTAMAGPMLDQIDQQKNQISNMTGPIDDAREQLTAFTNVSELDFGSGFNISDVRAQLQDIVDQLSDLSRFNFSESMIDNAIQSVNNITCPIIVMGQEYCFFYTIDNITLLNPDEFPYDQDPDVQQQLRDKMELFNSTLERFAEINATVEELKFNISIIDGKLAGIDVAFTTVMNLGSTISGYTGQISDQLDRIIGFADDIKDNITNIVEDLRGLLHRVDGWTDLTRCGFIGSLYEGLKYNVCTVLSTSFEVMAAGHFVIGMGMTVLFFLFCISSICICDCKRSPKIRDKRHDDTDDL